MAIWYLTDLERLVREQAAISELEASTDWLLGSDWQLDRGTLTFNAIIRVHGHDYHLRMTYPDYFPSSPPTVCPVNAQIRWTIHQYGDINGPLCLEWGQDNWHPEVTGAQVLASAYRLLSIEEPLGGEQEDLNREVPSRHQLTLGQELRSSEGRLYISPGLHALLITLPSNSSGTIKFSLHIRPSSWLGLIHQAHPLGAAEAWNDEYIPPAMKGSQGDGSLYPGLFYKTNQDTHTVKHVKDVDSLVAILEQAGYEADFFTRFDNPNPFGLPKRPEGVMILDKTNHPHFFFVFNEKVIWPWICIFSENTDVTPRQPKNLAELSSKSVGIVGLGSAGSKIAESLTRMGISWVHLVDHDILLPENIVRHSLDWRNVAEHKVEGVQELLFRINSSVKVTVSPFHLTGQESTLAINRVLRSLGQCDIIIDATANPRVFNLLAHLGSAEEKPLVWFEIYAGGTGGMIARSRPGYDPDPHTIRAVYYRYLEENPAPEDAILADYMAEDMEGQVLAASDADVGIIAHHVARFVADTVLNLDNYPYSLYLIGLSPWWVFNEPFQTIPITTDQIPRNTVKPEQDQATQEQGVRFLLELLKHDTDGTDTAS